MVRPCASTPHVDERSTTATGCCGAGAGASGGTAMTITLAMPSSAATSSGTSATTPPSISVWPSNSTGGNTPGNAELATIADTTSPDSRMNGRPVARSVAMIVSGIGACSIRRAPRCLRRKAMPWRLSRNERALAGQRQRQPSGMHPQQVSAPHVGPDALEPADAVGLARPGDTALRSSPRRTHRSGGRAGYPQLSTRRARRPGMRRARRRRATRRRAVAAATATCRRSSRH